MGYNITVIALAQNAIKKVLHLSAVLLLSFSYVNCTNDLQHLEK